MLLNQDIFNEDNLAYSRLAYPKFDILSEKPKYTLHWLDVIGHIPIRSLVKYPILLEENLQNYDIVFESNCHLFHMNDDLEAYIYNLVKDRAHYNWYAITKEETKWDDNNNIIVWLEWVQRYYEENPNIPKED